MSAAWVALVMLNSNTTGSCEISNKWGHLSLILLNSILDNTMENNRKMMDDHHGVSPLVARNQVTTRIPAP